MAIYYGAKYFGGTAPEQTIPTCSRGTVKMWQDSITIGTALATTDTIMFARMPAGHAPLRLELFTPDTWDSGTGLALNIGTTADADMLGVAIVVGHATAAGVWYVMPLAGATTHNPALLTAAVPTADYNIVAVPTAAATTATTGTAYFRLWYTAPDTIYDPANSPAVVTS